MRFNCAGKNADKFLTPTSSREALPKYLPSQYIEFQVAHELGHFIQVLFSLWKNSAFTESPLDTRTFIQRALADTDLESRLGTRWQLPHYTPAQQNAEFFADFFAYVHCGKDVPESYKTVLDQIIHRWFPNLPSPTAPIVTAQPAPQSDSTTAPGKAPTDAPAPAGPNPSRKSGSKKSFAKHKQHKHKRKK